MDSVQNLMSVQDFIEHMNKNVAIGQNKIYELVKQPGFPSVKIGQRYYVLIDQVNNWLEAQSRKKD